MVEKYQLNPEDYLILIVDDTEANVKLLSHVLRQIGLKPIAAFNGKDAVELVKERQPDLVLLDILMPDMTGYEVCSIMNNDEDLKDIPVIFLSALSDTDNKIEGFKAGGVDYITKPFQKDEVLARIKTHLEIRKLQKERDERIQILRDRETELRELNKKKDNLVRMVSHDIKNPLTGIIGLANMLRKDLGFSEDDKTRMLEVMEESGTKLLDMVEKMLDIESTQQESSEAKLTETDLRELASKVISVHNPKAILKNISLSFEEEIKTSKVMMDQVKMEVALNNLVANALKFTSSKGSVVLAISTDEESVHFKVSDTGIGIPDTLIDSIFDINNDRFPVSQKGTDGEIGTGLGLDVVKNYVNIHNGEVWVESEVDSGTTFFIDIPLIRSN